MYQLKGITHYIFIGTLSGANSKKLKGTTKASEAGCDDVDQSAIDRTITFADEETKTAL